MPGWLGRDTDWNDVRRIATGIDVRKRVGAGHDPVSLTTEADVLLEIGAADTPQEIDLDTQAANTVFAGPTAGGDAAPTFRALVAADLGSLLPQPVAQGDMLLADATPAWAILTLGGAAGYALVTTATTAAWDQTPTWSGSHTHQANLILDDGVSDSPELQFVGGANDDTISIYLNDSVTAGNSDLILKLCAADTDSKFEITDSSDAVVAYIDADGNATIDGKLGIGTEAVPHGGVGYARVAIEGANASSSGPHVQFTTASDDYPLLAILPLTHDNVGLIFDGYYDGSDPRSSDAGSNFSILKNSDQLQFRYEAGIAASNVITWSMGFALDAGTGDVCIGNNLTGAKLMVDQADTSGAKPTLYLIQQDESEDVIRIQADASNGVLTNALVDEGDQASETREGWVKVYIIDDGNRIADGAYYVPFYSLSA